jgi:hypothetical protein
MAVSMKNGVFWDVTPFFLTEVIMKNVVFCYVTPYGSRKNGHIGGTYRLHHQEGKSQRA